MQKRSLRIITYVLLLSLLCIKPITPLPMFKQVKDFITEKPAFSITLSCLLALAFVIYKFRPKVAVQDFGSDRARENEWSNFEERTRKRAEEARRERPQGAQAREEPSRASDSQRARPHCGQREDYNDFDRFRARYQQARSQPSRTNNSSLSEELKAAYRLLGINENASCWEILGQSAGSSEKKIDEAWKKLCKRWHPDRATFNKISPEMATLVMQIINEAHDKCLRKNQPDDGVQGCAQQ